jgi:hypothetical protein
MSTPAAAIAEVERIYLRALIKAKLTPDTAARALLLGPVWALATSWFTSDQEKAVQKQLSDLWEQIRRWKTEMRSWAQVGRNPSGGAYGWDRWAQYGRELGDAAAYHAGEAWNGSVVLGVAAAEADAARRVARAISAPIDALSSLPEIPTWAWYAGGALVTFVAVAYVVRTFQ